MTSDTWYETLTTLNGTGTHEDWVTILQTVILSITTILVIVGNILCFLVLLQRSRDASEVTRLCLLNLTATDTAIGFLIGIPITGATAVDGWPYGDAFCMVVAGSTILVSLSGIFLVAVNVERFVAIVWPLRSGAYLTLPRAKLGLAGVWVLGAVFAAVYCFLPGRKAVFHPHFHTCFVDPEDPKQPDTFGVMAALMFAILPFLTTLFLYARLYQIARRHIRQINVLEVCQLQNRRVIRKSDLKTATTFFIITAVLALSWMPFATVICYENLTRLEVNPTVAFIALVFLLSNSYWNIVIYCFRNKKFRKAGLKFVRECIMGGGSSRSRSNEIEASKVMEETPVFVIANRRSGTSCLPSVG